MISLYCHFIIVFSLRSVVDKPPIGEKELLPLTGHSLSGFRLNPGPVSVMLYSCHVIFHEKSSPLIEKELRSVFWNSRKWVESFHDDTQWLRWGPFDMLKVITIVTYYRFLSSFASWVNIRWRKNTSIRSTKAKKVNGVKMEVRQSTRGQIHWSKTSLLPLLLVNVIYQLLISLGTSCFSCCCHIACYFHSVWGNLNKLAY